MKISVNNKEVGDSSRFDFCIGGRAIASASGDSRGCREPFGAPYRVGRLCVGRGDEHCHHQSGVRRIAFSHSIQ